MAIRCITFDWGDTLACNHGNAYRFQLRRALDAFAMNLDEAGHHPPDGWIAQAHATVCHDWQRSGDLQAHPDHREIDAMQSLAGCLGLIPGLSEDSWRREPVAGCIAHFFATFLTVIVPFAGVRETLAACHAHGYRIGVLSHVLWPPEHCLAWYARWGLAEHVDFYSLSSGVGWIKPHPAHYEDAIAQAGCRPEEILHVGDHPWRDIQAAREHGLHTCLRRTEGLYPEDQLDSCHPDLSLVHVKELPALLQRQPWNTWSPPA